MREDFVEGSPPETVGIGEAAARLGIPEKTLRRLADSGAFPSTRTPGGHRRFAMADLVAGPRDTPSMTHSLLDEPADWSGSFEREGLDESVVWSQLDAALGLEASDAIRLMNYAFTEMLNNAIDHSEGSRIDIRVWLRSTLLGFSIRDDGVGVFARLRTGIGLESDLQAAAELTKGKRTTWPERHTGEGIFFTSKAVSLFRLSANGIRLTVDNRRDDYALGVGEVQRGTLVEAEIAVPLARSLRDVFEEFTDEDLTFSRSRPRVELFGTGLTFVSRSEARRLLTDMTGFTDIDIDFAGVQDVGQGFVDELLRVWPSQHPGITLHPMNMNEAVSFMVRRGLRAGS